MKNLVKTINFVCLAILLFAFCNFSMLANADENTDNNVLDFGNIIVDDTINSQTVNEVFYNNQNEEDDALQVKGIGSEGILTIDNSDNDTATIEPYEAPYSAVYNYEYYSSNNADLVAAYGNDRKAYLDHFLRWGMSEGRSGNSIFDPLSYFNLYPDLRLSYQGNLKQYYMHYLNFGRFEGRITSRCKELQGVISELGGVNYAPVYDFQYYMANNSDLVSAFTYRGRFINDVAFLSHFINFGMNEGRSGNSTFRVIWYYNRYSDVRFAYGSNLHDVYMHYLYWGSREGRDNSRCDNLVDWISSGWESVYDPQFYYNNNSDLKAIATKSTPQGTFIDDKWLWEHMYNYGASEWRSLNATFDVVSYYYANPDLRAAYGSNTKAYYTHYIQYGKKEGRLCTGVTSLLGKITSYDGYNYASVYNPDYYTSAYGDINENAHFVRRGVRFLNDGWAMWHFVNWGMNEERTGNGSFYPRSYWCQYSDIRRACGSYMPNLYRHYCDYGVREGRAGSGCWTLSGDVDFDNRLIALTRQFSTLWSAFAWVGSFPYAYQDEWPSWGGWKLDIARQMLNDGRGNCYRYACLFMYMARALGYDADVRCGTVPTRSGWAAHGWTEVYENGGTYVCDLSFYHSVGGNGWFMTPYSNARLNYRINY